MHSGVTVMSRHCRSFWVRPLNFCTYPAVKITKQLAFWHQPPTVYSLSTTFLNQTVVKVANTGFLIYLFYLVCSTKKKKVLLSIIRKQETIRLNEFLLPGHSHITSAQSRERTLPDPKSSPDAPAHPYPPPLARVLSS